MGELDQARLAGEAIRKGDFDNAFLLLQPLIAKAGARPEYRLMYAHVALATGRFQQACDEADRLIATHPDTPRPYLIRADATLKRGDSRAASAFYSAAIAHAEGADTLPADLAREIDRARDALAELELGFAELLETELSIRGFTAENRSARFAESLEILNGSKPLQLQRPTAYYFPGLPQRGFYSSDEFEWAASLEAATPAIAAELARAISNGRAFKPYVLSDSSRPQGDVHGLRDNPEWSSLELTAKGTWTDQARTAFPATVAALSVIPLDHISVRAPTVMFSRLAAGGRIPPHHGMLNTRLICHLPLTVPGSGALRVGNAIHEWQRGKLLIFDDTFEHEAWNDASSDRIVLIFDIWRPELTHDEQAMICALFDTIDFSGDAHSRQILQ